MKKIFAIVLAGIMMLSLAACGGTGSSTPAAASSEPAGASGTPASSAPAASTLSGKVTTGGSTSVEFFRFWRFWVAYLMPCTQGAPLYFTKSDDS